MKRFGLFLMLIGVMMLAGSCGLFGLSIKNAMSSRLVESTPVKLGKTASTKDITVATDHACQVTIRADVKTKSIREETRFDEKTFEARYSFPVSYTVLDGQGKTLLSEKIEFASEGGGLRTIENEKVTAASGSLTVEQGFQKFDVPPPGIIQVRLSMSPDSRYGARAENLELRVYDHVSRQKSTILSGATMTCAGPLFIAFGFFVFIAGLFQKTKRQRRAM